MPDPQNVRADVYIHLRNSGYGHDVAESASITAHAQWADDEAAAGRDPGLAALWDPD